MKVPQSFESLFKTLEIYVRWERSGKAARVGWSYDHPGGGSNGFSIGYILFDEAKGAWGWRLEDGRWGIV